MAISHVQTKGVQSSGAVASVSLTLDATTASGNTFIALAGNYRNSGVGSTTTLTDNKSNTWVRDPSNSDSNWSEALHYTTTQLAGASHQFTCTQAATNGFISFTVSEFSGIDTADPFHASSGANGTSTAPASNNVAVNTNGLLIGGMTQDGASTTISPGASLTTAAEDETDDSQPYHTLYRVVTTATNYTTSWTLGASRSWRTATASFNEGAAGAATSQGCRHGLSIPHTLMAM